MARCVLSEPFARLRFCLELGVLSGLEVSAMSRCFVALLLASVQVHVRGDGSLRGTAAEPAEEMVKQNITAAGPGISAMNESSEPWQATGSDSVDLDSVEVVASSETGENKDMESAEDVSVMAEGQCGNIFCSRSQVCCRTGNGATHICGAPGSTCCRTRNGATVIACGRHQKCYNNYNGPGVAMCSR